MSYLKFGNKINHYGNSIFNFGENFVLKIRGSSFPSNSSPTGSLVLKFSTNQNVVVDYGDGTRVIYTTTYISKDVYQLVFNNQIVHIYADGLNISRNITFSFNRNQLIYFRLVNQPLQISDFVFEFNKYTQLLYFELINERFIVNLNIESIVGSQITTFSIADSFVSSSRHFYSIPIEIFSTPLITLGVGTSGYPTVNFATSNFDKIYLLKNTLKSLIVTAGFGDDNFGDGPLPSNFSELINLKTLQLCQSKHTISPAVINQITSITTLSIIYNSFYRSYGDISSLINLDKLNFTACKNITDTIPVYFNNFTKIKVMNYVSCFITQIRIDNFINNVYLWIISNASITGSKSLPFRGITVDIGSDSGDYPPPSGIYQQPSGFILGSNNGTPASPQERRWVMVNQYGHVWTFH